MRIWTTPKLSELFLEDELPLKLVPERIIKEAFLKDSVIGDIAVINIDADYLDFLAAIKARGISGPVIFVSPEPTIIQENLQLYNAIILDLKRIGLAGARSIVNFILKLAMERFMSVSQHALSNTGCEGMPEERPIEDPSKIEDVLTYIQKGGISVIVAFQILEDGEPVTVRGICKIKTIKEDTIVLYEFRPSLFIKGFKEGIRIKAVLTYRYKNYEAVMNILKVDDDEIHASIPERLFVERRRHVRIEPGPKRPVHLYMLIQGEPTITLKVTDISQHGIGFTSPRDLQVGGIYGFAIILPEPQEVVLCYGVIRFKREYCNTFRYGAELQVYPRDEENIARYIMKRELEIIELLRDM